MSRSTAPGGGGGGGAESCRLIDGGPRAVEVSLAALRKQQRRPATGSRGALAMALQISPEGGGSGYHQSKKFFFGWTRTGRP